MQLALLRGGSQLNFYLIFDGVGSLIPFHWPVHESLRGTFNLRLDTARLVLAAALAGQRALELADTIDWDLGDTATLGLLIHQLDETPDLATPSIDCNSVPSPRSENFDQTFSGDPALLHLDNLDPLLTLG